MTDFEAIEAKKLNVIPGSVWRHYKGTLYVVTEVSIDEATAKVRISYVNALRPDDRPWDRPLSEWVEVVTFRGVASARYTFVEAPAEMVKLFALARDITFTAVRGYANAQAAVKANGGKVP